jgi:PAS domain S-box-containing protein
MHREGIDRILEELSDIVTVIDPDGTITYVSPAVKQMLGYDPEELIGEVGYEYQHPDDREVVANAIEALQTQSEDTQRVETRFRRADGSWCWIEATMQDRVADEDIGGIVVSSRDISERKRKEQQFRDLAEEYRQLLENVEDAIFFLSVESEEPELVFRFERLNQAYEDQTGINTDDVRGKTPTAVFGDDVGKKLEANYRRCVETSESIRYQEELNVEPDARFWQTNLTPVITGGTVTQIIGITRNVTKRVKQERKLESQKEQLNEFANVVSHDLRNPLNVAQGRSALLEADCNSEHLAPVIRSLDRMEAIVTDTLTLARQGQVVSEPEPIQLVSLLGKCWKNVPTDEATIDIADETTIQGDRTRLQHVFENLFRNAIEHGGTDVTVRVGQIDDHGIYVEDTGPGIPDDAHEAVFDPGHTSATGGTGFGLTIVRRIAEAHGWEVTVAADNNSGARFEFTGVVIDNQ